MTYTIRIPRDTVVGTFTKQPGYWSAGSKNSDSRMKYFSGGFIYLQNMIDNGFIKSKNESANPLGVYMQEEGYYILSLFFCDGLR